MKLDTLIDKRGVLANLKAASKKQALELITERAADITGLKAFDILTTVLQREKLGSTGMGQGIAIPHGKIEELDGLVALFAKLETPVAFDSIDDQPVDLIFMLLAPSDAGADHLRALAKISRLMRQPDFTQELRAAQDQATLYKLLTKPPLTDAA